MRLLDLFLKPLFQTKIVNVFLGPGTVTGGDPVISFLKRAVILGVFITNPAMLVLVGLGLGRLVDVGVGDVRPKWSSSDATYHATA